jgi:hypothetical protein
MITLNITTQPTSVELSIQVTAISIESGGNHDLEFGSDRLIQ